MLFLNALNLCGQVVISIIKFIDYKCVILNINIMKYTYRYNKCLVIHFFSFHVPKKCWNNIVYIVEGRVLIAVFYMSRNLLLKLSF